ncbi:MAG TPA: helix-turn-helix domain-containing protein [Mycobacterium sp.]|nr:helix-turn-helix domain-containing protein [Mycobacterium sp.]
MTGNGGAMLRQWRQRRRRSQLDLALDTGISARHLSFVETGRSRPSRGLLLALAEQLEVPLRERNALMLASGYAPTYAESDLDSAEAAQAREAIERLLTGHEPYPAVLLDRWGDVVSTNGSVGPLLEGVDPELLTPPINTYRLSLHPKGLVSRIHNRAEWTAHLGHRLARLARLTGDPRLADLLAEVRAYPGVAETLDELPESTSSELLLTLQLAHPAGDLRLHSTVTSFGSPHDVTLSELTIESFFPADDATRQRLQEFSRQP